MKLAGGVAIGSSAGTVGASTIDQILPIGSQPQSHEHPSDASDFDEREWGYVLTDFEEPQGRDNPVVFSITGYESASRSGRPSHYVRMADDTLLALNVGRWRQYPSPSTLSENYVLAQANIRGTGCSEGRFNLFDPTRGQDGYELIEWLADRPWSMDQIGLYGASYGGLEAFPIAATQPPSLTAMMANLVIGDYYRGFSHPGGVPQTQWTDTWTHSSRPSAAENGKDLAVGNGDEICEQIGGGAGEHHPDEDVGDMMLTRHQDNLEYASRNILSYADEITVPTYVSHAWQDQLTGPRGGPEIFRAISPDPIEPGAFPGRKPPRPEVREEPKFLRTTSGGHGTALSIGDRDAQRWFDYWLLGEGGPETGNDKGNRSVAFGEAPRIKHFLTTKTSDSGIETGGAVSGTDFPGETEWVRYYFREDNTLATTAPDSSESPDTYTNEIFDNWFVGGDLSANDSLLTYQSAPVEEPKLIAGPIAATLFAETRNTDTDPTDTDFFVSVADVYPDGTHATYLQKGMLRASHRALDSRRTLHNEQGDIIRPYHPHTNPVDIHTETVYQYEIEVFPLVHVLHPGHRLLVNVHAPPENDFGNAWGYDAIDNGAENVLHHGSSNPSSILFPMQDWPGDSAVPPEPECGEPDLYNCIDIS